MSTPVIAELTAVKRLVSAARALLEDETEVARTSYTRYDGETQAPVWNDAVWAEEDPFGAAIAIELREALRAFE